MAGSYLKSLQLAKQLEERAKEATRNKELAEKEYEALQEFLRECKDNDIDLSDVNKNLSDYNAAIGVKDYQSAVAHAKKAMETARSAYVRKATEVIESVEVVLSHLSRTGSEPKAVREQLEKSKDQLGKGDLDIGMKTAKGAYDAAERAVHEYVSDMFSQAQDTLMQAKDTGEDVSIFDDLLARAKSALESQDYETAISNVREALEGAGENLRLQANTAITRAEELIVAAEELGADANRVRNNIDRSKKQLEELRFKESLAYAKRAETEAEKTIASRFQELLRTTRESIKKVRSVRDDVTVPQQLLDEAQEAIKDKKYIEAIHAMNLAKERVDQMQFQAVLDVISKARDRFVLAKKVGVDLTRPIMLLNTARDNLKLGKFEDSMQYAEESRQVVDDALTVFYNARDQIAQLGDAIKFAAGLGADIGTLKNYLAEARKSFEAKDYARTIETVRDGLGEAKKAAHDTAMTVVDDADRSLKLAKSIGADVAEAEGVLQRAVESLSKEEIGETVDFAKSSIDAARAAMTRVLSDRLQSIDQFIKGYADSSDAVGINEVIAEARQNLAAFNFEKTNELLSQVTKRIEESAKEECARLLDVASERLRMIESMGGDVADLEILMKRGEDASSRKVYEDAAARAREVISLADEMTVKLVQAEFSAIKDTFEEARAVGIGLEDHRTSLKEAQSKAAAKNYVEAYEAVRTIKTDLREKISRHDSIKDKIRRAEELILEAEKNKADVTGAEQKLDMAKREFENSAYDKAQQLLDECIAETERSLAMYLAAKFILSSKEVVDIAEAHGIDVSGPADFLATAKQEMKEKNYDEALAAAKKSEEDAKGSISSAIGDMIKDLQRLVIDARNVGVDTDGPEKLAEKAVSLSKAGDYVEALKCISTAKDDIEHVRNLSAHSTLEIKTARTNMKNAETLGIDVEQSRELLDQAVEALTRHQYAIATELAKKSSETSIGSSKSKIRDTLEEFKNRVEKAASEGAPLGLAERCVAEGLAAFEAGKYEESLKLAMKCEAELDRAELQRTISGKAVEMARRRLNEAVDEGIVTEEVAGRVKRAEALLREGKFVDALSAAIESGDELLRIRDGMDDLRIEFSAAREHVERLRKIRIDTAQCDEILEMAQECLTRNETVKCRQLLAKCSSKAASLFEVSIKDIIKKDRQMISSAKSMGINTKPCEDLLEVANTSLSEKLWDFAYQQAVSCRQKCLELIAKKISSLIDEVQGKLTMLRRIGASVRTIEELIENARRAGASGDIDAAFNLLMEVDNKMALTEAAQKKYTDIMIAAESSIENLGRFGLSKREAERLLDMAEIEREKDYDSAIELVAEALDTATNIMDSFSPEVSMSIDSPGLQEGVEGTIEVVLKNQGRALAKDLSVTIAGDLETVAAGSLQVLKPGAEESVKVRVRPRTSGEADLVVRTVAKRHFDGRELEFELEDTLKVYPGGPAFKQGRAKEVSRCSSCQGKIKAGFDMVSCRCGAQLHLACAKRSSKCPVCGQKYDF